MEATMPDFFPGFEQRQIETTGATINLVTGGGGPPLLLLHGYPQTHVMWRKMAPRLAQDFTVVVPDLRGYGDSSKPPAGENFINYSKRALALDQVEVMAALGHDRFAVAGHDRGARVTHRLLRDHPDKISRGATLDIVPTLYRFETSTTNNRSAEKPTRASPSVSPTAWADSNTDSAKIVGKRRVARMRSSLPTERSTKARSSRCWCSAAETAGRRFGSYASFSESKGSHRNCW
jgi:pimeloyl-ACP methyl ester carboxylesterase